MNKILILISLFLLESAVYAGHGASVPAAPEVIDGFACAKDVEIKPDFKAPAGWHVTLFTVTPKKAPEHESGGHGSGGHGESSKHVTSESATKSGHAVEKNEKPVEAPSAQPSEQVPILQVITQADIDRELKKIPPDTSAHPKIPKVKFHIAVYNYDHAMGENQNSISCVYRNGENTIVLEMTTDNKNIASPLGIGAWAKLDETSLYCFPHRAVNPNDCTWK